MTTAEWALPTRAICFIRRLLFPTLIISDADHLADI